MEKLPQQYNYLNNPNLPKMVKEAVAHYGLEEVVGKVHNDKILQMGSIVGIQHLVKDDEQAWCGLFLAYIAVRSQKFVPMKSWDILRALKWVQFGVATSVPMMGDVLIFRRDGGGHVCLYVGEDDTHYHCIGGNQGNKVSITRIAKNRLFSVRRPVYTNQPEEVKRIFLSPTGVVSTNES